MFAMKHATIFAGMIGAALLCSSCATWMRPKHPVEAQKLRVLVDKVLMRSNNWVMTEDHVREIADAGFNVVSPRLGGDDPARVRKVAELAGRHGLMYMAWMRGSLATETGVKYVHEDGHDQPIYSPNADELWDWMTDLILAHARISTEVPALVGSFLDFENYAKGKSGNCYALSYDTKILGEFAAAEGIEIPELGPDKRAGWLRDKGLHARFERFQIASWRRRARALREAVDAINPRYLLIIYPAPGTLFMTEGLYPEWATRQAPLVLADASTYGRPMGFMDQRESLETNRAIMRRRMKTPAVRRTPHIYLGGIDPVVDGADPEFCGKNAAMLAEVSDGYWVFYEGPEYETDHKEYFHWFKLANQGIARGDFSLWHEPRTEPENLGRTTVEKTTGKPQIAVYSGRDLIRTDIAAEGVFEVHEMEGVSRGYLSNFDVVLLQNFNVDLDMDHVISRNLRQFVEQGGGLMLGHDTAWFMESMFPEIAVRARPTHNVEAERHVVDSQMVVAREHACIPGMKEGDTFETEFRDHMIFEPGPQGTVVIRNRFGDPVYVVGECGKGRVVFSGCYYGYKNSLTDGEKKAVMGMLEWLGKRD
jgi:hypothetical protein